MIKTSLTILKPRIDSAVLLPLFGSTVAAGFPSPADDFIEDRLDLNELLITNRPATYLVRVAGDSMIGAAICNNDILIVDASVKPLNRSIVVAAIEGEFLVKRYCLEKEQVLLRAENPAYEPVIINPDDDFSILGVVTGVVRQIK